MLVNISNITNSDEFTASIALEASTVDTLLDFNYEEIPISLESVWVEDSVAMEDIRNKVKTMTDKIKSNLPIWLNKLILFYFSFWDKLIKNVISLKKYLKSKYEKLLKLEKTLNDLELKDKDKVINVKNYLLHINKSCLLLMIINTFFNDITNKMTTLLQNSKDDNVILSIMSLINITLELTFNLNKIHNLDNSVISKGTYNIEKDYKSFYLLDDKGASSDFSKLLYDYNLEIFKVFTFDKLLDEEQVDKIFKEFSSKLEPINSETTKSLKAISDTLSIDKIESKEIDISTMLNMFKFVITTFKQTSTNNSNNITVDNLSTNVLKLRKLLNKTVDNFKKNNSYKDDLNKAILQSIMDSGKNFNLGISIIYKNFKFLNDLFNNFEKDVKILIK